MKRKSMCSVRADWTIGRFEFSHQEWIAMLPTIEWEYENNDSLIGSWQYYKIYVNRMYGTDDVVFYMWSVHYKNMIEDWDWFEQPIATTDQEAIDYATISFYFNVTDYESVKFIPFKPIKFTNILK